MPCNNCGATPASMMRCSVCLSVHYCNADCQRNDWSNHKASCTTIGAKALIQAVKNEEMAEIKRLIKTHRVVKASVDNSTALFAAAGNGNADIVRMLLEAGANVNYQASDGFTALMMAVRDGHVEVAQILVEAGANTQAGNFVGLSAITMAEMMASGGGRTVIMEGQTPEQARAATMAKGRALVEILNRGY